MKKTCFIIIILTANTLLVTAQTVKGKTPPQKPSLKELAQIKKANIKKAAKTQFQYFIIQADSATYGYSIYADGILYIQQNSIPAIPGNKGFADTATAAKCAQVVIQKIKQGEMPPSLTVEELKKNNLINKE